MYWKGGKRSSYRLHFLRRNNFSIDVARPPPGYFFLVSTHSSGIHDVLTAECMTHPEEGAIMAGVAWRLSHSKASNGGRTHAFRCRTMCDQRRCWGRHSQGLMTGHTNWHHFPHGLMNHAIFSVLQLYCKYSVVQSQRFDKCVLQIRACWKYWTRSWKTVPWVFCLSNEEVAEQKLLGFFALRIII